MDEACSHCDKRRQKRISLIICQKIKLDRSNLSIVTATVENEGIQTLCGLS